MKRTRKYLRFENIKLQLEEVHPEEVSRVHLKLIEEDTQLVHKTQSYANIQPKTIIWQQSIEFPYTSQQKLKFETACEHQYAYEIQELKALYNGTLYIKTENFFQNLSTHLFNSQGSICGSFKYMIKVVERQQSTAKTDRQPQVQEQVKIDLFGRITFYSASLKITNPNFNPKKHTSLKLIIVFGQIVIESEVRSDCKWNFPGNKIEVLENSPKTIQFYVKEGDTNLLNGKLQIQQLQRDRRFLTQQITLEDLSAQKIGILKLDVRYIEKKELLDLLYSPTQLSTSQIQYQNKNKQKQKIISSNKVTPLKHTSQNQLPHHKKSQQQLYNILNNHQEMGSESRSINRYKKVHVINSYNQIIIPKTKRFVVPRTNNPYVSYIDPNKMSDFSPSNKGASISSSNKSDFTRQYKGNPGVGQYKLPSIWDKY